MRKTATLSYMSEYLRTVVIAVAGIILAIIGAYGITAHKASAPTETVPAILESTPQESEEISAEPEHTTPTVSEEPKPVAPIPAETPEVKPVVAPPPVSEVIQTITSPATTTPEAPHTLNDTVRQAVVNIICTVEAGGSPLSSISASGVIVDPRGVIMTNAHVAQYMLLKDYPVTGAASCVVRTGSPAQPKYTVELLFISPSWIQNNSQKILQSHPTGNGDHDYAFLRITGTTNPNATLPASFPAIPISETFPSEGDAVLVAAYPAGFLGGITIAKDLYQLSANATVGDLYTFETSTVDLFSVGGTVVAQQGSSGGAVTDANGSLIGLIVTTTDAPETGARDLRAIAMPYLFRDFKKETGIELQTYVAGDLAVRAQQFNLGTAPTLTQTLIHAIGGF